MAGEPWFRLMRPSDTLTYLSRCVGTMYSGTIDECKNGGGRTFVMFMGYGLHMGELKPSIPGAQIVRYPTVPIILSLCVKNLTLVWPKSRLFGVTHKKDKALHILIPIQKAATLKQTKHLSKHSRIYSIADLYKRYISMKELVIVTSSHSGSETK